MRWRQYGQSMAEYVIVCAGLIAGLLVTNNVSCDANGKSTTCMAQLLNVMHDNYDGYSGSISAVQKYGDYATSGEPSDGYGSGVGGGPDDGSGGTGEPESPFGTGGLVDAMQVLSSGGDTTYGTLYPDGTVLDEDGNLVGIYSEIDNTIELIGGGRINVVTTPVVVDEDGNILHLQAVTSCVSIGENPVPVYSWGYVSDDKVYNSVNKEEMAIDGLCTHPSFKVVKDGEEQGGRILNSEYFAAVYAVGVSPSPLSATGDVVYWEEDGLCTVLVRGWDAAIDPEDELSDEEYYDAQKNARSDPDYYLGELDPIDYLSQTALYGVARSPNDCPTSNIISAP